MTDNSGARSVGGGFRPPPPTEACKDRGGSLYKLIYTILCAAFVVLMVFYYIFGKIGTLEIRGIFLLGVLMLTFFPKSADRAWKQALDILCVGLSIVTGWYFVTHNYEMKLSFFNLDTMSLIMGIIILILILEATRRKIGIAMPLIAVAFLLYAFFGYLVPGKYNISGYSIDRVVNITYTGTEGIYGVPLGVMVSTVFLFILFSGLLQTSGAGNFFINFAHAAFGKVTGGPAKMAVVSSMFFGTINGSAVANTVATGSFTIPLMKKSGYDAEFAGAVEAVASTGGQIMPPIMGAGAFLIAELAGIPYSRIALLSIVPAILYFGSIFLTIHFETKKKNLRALPTDEIPSLKKTIAEDGMSIIPLLLLVIMLFVFQFSIQLSGMIATLTILLLGILRNKGKRKYIFIKEGIHEAINSMLPIAVSCACAGIIVAMISLTGLGYNFSSTLFGLASGNLILALLLLFSIGLILGMGLPTVAAFILMISIAGNGLTALGLPVLSAYLIAFWFSQTSAITPPVCLAAYAAAGIAKAKPFRVGIKTLKIGFPLLVIPFLFAYRSLLFTGTIADSILTIITGILGILAFCTAFSGYFFCRFRWFHYPVAFAAGVCCFWPNAFVNLAGVCLLILLIISVRWNHQKKSSA